MRHYSINTDQVTWEVADGEAVVLHFASSAYYALNPSGTYIWNRLAEGYRDLPELTETVAGCYGKAPAEIAADLAAFLASLEREDLVSKQASPNDAPGRSSEEFAANGDYQPPQLTRLGELEKLILSGE